MSPSLAPVVVTDEQGLLAVADFLKRTRVFGFDTETTVVDNFIERKIRTIQLGDRNEQYIIDLLAFAGSSEGLSCSQGNYGAAAELLLGPVINTLREALESTEWTKVGINLQFDYEVLRWNLGIRSHGFYDCFLAEKNIHAGLVHLMASGFWAAEDLIRRYLGLELQDTTTGKTFDLETPLTETQVTYCALDARLPLPIRSGQLEIIEREGLQNAVKIDFDAISPFGDMHIHGFGLSDERWQALIDTNTERRRVILARLDHHFIPVVGTKFISEADTKRALALEDLWRDCPQKTPEDKERRKTLRCAYMEFKNVISAKTRLAKDCQGEAAINYASPKQLTEAFRKMGYSKQQLKNTNDKALEKRAKFPLLTVGKVFEDLSILETLPAVDTLRLFRSVDKLLTTYGSAWLKTQEEGGHRNKYTGRIHSNINLFGADTGRTSSSSPNVQNIPKEVIYRHAFTARPGYRVLTIDYSGCELRILAFLSQEPVWLEAFAKGWDLHSVGAEMLFGKRWVEAADPGCAYYAGHKQCKCKGHKKLRSDVKSINFGLAYGLSAAGLAAQLNISMDEAEKLLAAYKAAFPVVMAYLEKIGVQAKTKLRVDSVEGGRRLWKRPDYEVAKQRCIADEAQRAKEDERQPRTITQEMIHNRYIRMASAIEREGKNAGIQRSNAYLTKRAMYLIWLELEPKFGAFWLNEVHDEVVIEVPEANADACMEFASQCMMAAGAEYIIGIPMTVEGSNKECWTK